MLSLRGPAPVPPGATDGQIIAVSGGRAVAQNPTGNSELAYAENATGTTQTGITTTATDVTACAIAVAASTRPVWLSAKLTLSATAGSGTTTFITARIVEVSNGVDTPIDDIILTLPLANNGPWITLEFSGRVGTTARTRNFKLQVNSSGNTITVFNGASVGGVKPKSWIRAMAA